MHLAKVCRSWYRVVSQGCLRLASHTFQSGSRLEKEEALLVSTRRELFDHLYKV